MNWQATVTEYTVRSTQRTHFFCDRRALRAAGRHWRLFPNTAKLSSSTEKKHEYERSLRQVQGRPAEQTRAKRAIKTSRHPKVPGQDGGVIAVKRCTAEENSPQPCPAHFACHTETSDTQRLQQTPYRRCKRCSRPAGPACQGGCVVQYSVPERAFQHFVLLYSVFRTASGGYTPCTRIGALPGEAWSGATSCLAAGQHVASRITEYFPIRTKYEVVRNTP